jgi:hypothetical protein
MSGSTGLWMTIAAIAFFAMLSVVSITQIDRDRQKQQHEIECVKYGGKMEFVFGSGTVCTNK